jgi:hypothetical protein
VVARLAWLFETLRWSARIAPTMLFIFLASALLLFAGLTSTVRLQDLQELVGLPASSVSSTVAASAEALYIFLHQ